MLMVLVLVAGSSGFYMGWVKVSATPQTERSREHTKKSPGGTHGMDMSAVSNLSQKP
jgi:hypothetical protein